MGFFFVLLGAFNFLWAGLGMFLAYFVLPTSPRSVSGLVWAIEPLICGAGHVSRVSCWQGVLGGS